MSSDFEGPCGPFPRKLLLGKKIAHVSKNKKSHCSPVLSSSGLGPLSRSNSKFLVKQAEKLKSREMVKDEGLMMKDEGND